MIAILAPYTRNEITAAALRVMDLALAQGNEVRYLACGQREKNVHPFWDKRIQHQRYPGIIDEPNKIDLVIHFQASERLYSRSTAIADVRQKQLRHVLVCTESQAETADPVVLYNYEKIVCTTRNGIETLQKRLDRKSRRKLVYLCWHNGMAPVHRAGRLTDDWLRICVYCDASTVDYCGPLTLQVIENTLQRYPHAVVTVLSSKRWCRHDHRTLTRQLLPAYKGRLLCKHLRQWDDLAIEYRQNDWVVLPSLRTYFGLPALTALTAGTPVVANNIQPYTQLIQPACGLLVPCTFYEGQRTSTAIPTLGNWLETTERAFGDPNLLYQLQQQDWGLAALREEFETTWGQIFTG